ncbi:MAG: pyridoxal-dependent decarboxylase [Cyclobacteriaceae bacterium]
MHKLQLSREISKDIWDEVWERLHEFQTNVDTGRTTPRIDVSRITDSIKSVNLKGGVDARELVTFAIENLQASTIHNQNASNFGVYGNGVSSLAIVTEAVVAAFNPQLANWIQSPFASALETYMIETFGTKFGYEPGKLDGIFTLNEAEAFQTAILTALNHKIPSFTDEGLSSLPKAPVLYVSKQTHPSFLKAARCCGIGSAYVTVVPNDRDQYMDTAALDQLIRDDLQKGLTPFMIAGTAGSIISGSIDPILEITAIAKHFKLWSHVDVGFGASALFLNNLNVLLEGIELADSISFDVAKFLSLPSDSCVLVTRHAHALHQTFSHDDIYIPADSFAKPTNDYATKSMQWSRRFAGLKAFTSLAQLGWKEYEQIHRRQCYLAMFLREKLTEGGWTIMNQTHLPVVCFSKPEYTVQDLSWINQEVISSGRAWVSLASIDETYCIRASVTNFKMTELDIIDLVDSLEEATETIWLRQNRIPEM